MGIAQPVGPCSSVASMGYFRPEQYHIGDHQNEKIQPPPPTNERHSPLPLLLENDHPQEQGSNSVENEEQHLTTNTSEKSTEKSAENAATTAATAPAAPAAAQSRKKPPPNAKASPRQRSLAKLHMNEP